MTIWHGAGTAGVFFAIFMIMQTLTSRGGIFSQWIYPPWFFALFGYIETYIIFMLPMFIGAVYLDDRRKAWRAMIIPSAAALVGIVFFGGYLFYEMGLPLLYMMLIYLAWGIACVLTPPLVWNLYTKLRDKLGGNVLFAIVSGIVSVVFVVVACAVIFTVMANIGKNEADYIPPHIANPPITTDAG